MTEITLYRKDWCWCWRTPQGEMECPPHVQSRSDIEGYFAGCGINWTIRPDCSHAKVLQERRTSSFAGYASIAEPAPVEDIPRPLPTSLLHRVPQTRRPQCRVGRAPTPVCQYDVDGRFIRRWDTLSEAAHAMGVSLCALSKCVNGIGGAHSAGGYRWSRDQMDFLPEDRRMVRGMCYAKYDLDGNRLEIYPSGVAAAQANDVTPGCIAQTFTGRQRSSAGCQWRRAMRPEDLPENIPPLSRAYGAGKKQPKHDRR